MSLVFGNAWDVWCAMWFEIGRLGTADWMLVRDRTVSRNIKG